MLCICMDIVLVIIIVWFMIWWLNFEFAAMMLCITTQDTLTDFIQAPAQNYVYVCPNEWN